MLPRKMFALALEAMISAYMNKLQQVRTSNEKAGMLHNGYHQERMITKSVGPIAVHLPWSWSSHDSLKPFVIILFPKYMKRFVSVE